MRGRRGVDVVLLAVAAAWGSSYLSAKVATGAAPVLVVLFWRYALSWLGTAPLLGRQRPSKPEWRLGGVLGLTQAAVLVLETFGVAHTSAANAGLIISLTVVLTPVVDSLRSADRVPLAFLAPAVTCVLGVALLSLGSDLGAPRLGDLLMLAAAVVRSGHVVLVGRLTRGCDVRSSALTFVQAGVGTVLFGAVAAPALGGSARFGAGTWAALAYLAIVCSVFAFVAQTWAIRRTSPSRASLLLGTEPVWAVVVGVVLGGDALGPLDVVGGLLIVGGAYWGQAIERRSRELRDAQRLAVTPMIT